MDAHVAAGRYGLSHDRAIQVGRADEVNLGIRSVERGSRAAVAGILELGRAAVEERQLRRVERRAGRAQCRAARATVDAGERSALEIDGRGDVSARAVLADDVHD